MEVADGWATWFTDSQSQMRLTYRTFFEACGIIGKVRRWLFTHFPILQYSTVQFTAKTLR